MKILAMVYERLQDKALGKLDNYLLIAFGFYVFKIVISAAGMTIKAFVQWTIDLKNNANSNPYDYYVKVVSSQRGMSQEISDQIDSALLDILMYDDKALVHEGLRLLMVHKNQQELYFETTEHIQIIYSSRTETIYHQLCDLLRDIQRLAEMFEIWSGLETQEDKASAAEMLEKLRKAQSYIVKSNDDKTLDVRSAILVDEEVN
jgi:hypothetical protein